MLNILSAQNVNIPNANFKAKLLAANSTNYIAQNIFGSYFKIDANNDGEISNIEAAQVGLLNVESSNINSLIGIESFTGIKRLFVSFNQITNLNVTGLTNLNDLYCSGNGMTTLNVGGLTNLKELYCGQNSITTLDVSTNVNLVTLLCYSNQIIVLNLNGLSNLVRVECNNLSSLSLSGLTSLKKLTCVSGFITSLDLTTTPNLEELYCFGNKITSLNVSNLSNLKILSSGNNLLTSLNIGSISNLIELSCSFNQLTTLNVSNLVSLKKLECLSNLLPSLNVSGLINLTDLLCSSNQIPSLDLIGLVNLKKLSCSNNLIPSLNLSSLLNLEDLSCQTNQLSVLDVSNSTNLKFLYCSQNQIQTLNLNGLTLLKNLKCELNQISSLNVNSCPLLTDLTCNNNLLTSLDVSNLTILNSFYCSNNLITSLDVSNSINLNFLYCDNNKLTVLNMKNGKNENFAFYTNLFLRYICADEAQIPAVQTMITNFGMNCNVNSYCSFVPGGVFYTIQGNNKYDLNNNGCDASDINFPKLALTFSNGSNIGNLIPNSSGSYSYTVQSGTHNFVPVLQNPTYFTVTPNASTVTFPNTLNTFNQDFCIAANGVHNDLEITLIPLGQARAGFNVYYKIIYTNKGTSSQSGNLNLAFDSAVLTNPVSNIAFSQSINNLNWSFTNLLPFESRAILVNFSLNSPLSNPPVNSGYLLTFNSNITSGLVDETPIDNVSVLNQTVVNAYDPNDKTCLEGGTIGLSKVGDFVHYMIRFENSGTANAQNIVVKDIIDTAKFDISSLVPIDGSHLFTTKISNSNNVEFIFNDINLPFTVGSNGGYLVFKIKTKTTLVAGNSFSNSANIYFDFNIPILTNTATTNIQTPLLVEDLKFDNYFKIYPTPAKNVLNIHFKNQIELSSIQVYNIMGQLVQVITNAKNINSIDVSELKSGNYFLKMITNQGTSSVRFVKD